MIELGKGMQILALYSSAKHFFLENTIFFSFMLHISDISIIASYIGASILKLITLVTYLHIRIFILFFAFALNKISKCHSVMKARFLEIC
jgi:hypothetical protein